MEPRLKASLFLEHHGEILCVAILLPPETAGLNVGCSEAVHRHWASIIVYVFSTNIFIY